MRLLIVGQAPARSSRGRAFEASSSGARLERLLGLQPGELMRAADTVNLLEEYPGPSGQSGDRFPLREARAKSGAVAALAATYDRVILCGSAVARALGVDARPLWSGAALGSSVLALPHPSGASRWWNDPANRRAALAAVREFTGMAPGLLREEA